MHHRQRGVAHVNIFWCLVPLVLMIGGAGYGYMKHVEADENLQARAEADAKADLFKFKMDERELQLEALTEVLGNAGQWKEPRVPRDDYKSPTNYTTPEKLKLSFTAFAGQLNIPASLKNLSEVLGSAQTELKKHTDQIGALEKQLQDTRAERDTARGTIDSVKTDLNGKISGLEANLAAARTTTDRQVADYSAQLQDAREKTRSANQAREAAAKAANEQISKRDDRILSLKAANTAKENKLKLINSPQEPDGKILSSSEATRTAWVNLGSKDNVKVGLTFRILTPTRTGYALKGHGYVTDVENDRAKIRITNLLNRLNPVVRNDLVANDLYSPSLKRDIYLLGRFGTPYSKGEVTRILETMGNKVHTEMSPSIDLVIVGREPVGGEDVVKLADTEEYRKAAEWNIEFAQLNKIRDFLKLR